ncbi:hypothetical protein A3Q56_01706 [Intoshia linei]|uniref:Uncharacterized protein n=1 Tax=Intoshia linei TaxID=1819745 RepID=A0A177BA69_9BILA|nr:hypothetical protein A3Q56_01706 [Intoshia linei]
MKKVILSKTNIFSLITRKYIYRIEKYLQDYENDAFLKMRKDGMPILCYIANLTDFEEDYLCFVARKLIKNGASVATKDDQFNRNALHYACYNFKPKLIEIFLNSMDYNINALDNLKNTALYYSCINYINNRDEGTLSVINRIMNFMKKCNPLIEKILNRKNELGITCFQVMKKCPELNQCIHLCRNSIRNNERKYTQHSCYMKNKLFSRMGSLNIYESNTPIFPKIDRSNTAPQTRRSYNTCRNSFDFINEKVRRDDSNLKKLNNYTEKENLNSRQSISLMYYLYLHQFSPSYVANHSFSNLADNKSIPTPGSSRTSIRVDHHVSIKSFKSESIFFNLKSKDLGDVSNYILKI